MKSHNTNYIIALFFGLLILILLSVFLFFPGISTDITTPIPELPPTGDGNNVSGTPTVNENQFKQISITRENVQSVIAALTRPAEYFYETQSELHYSGGIKQYLRRKWVRNSWARVDIMNGMESVETRMIYGGGKVFIWRPGDYEYYKTNAGSFTADTSQMIMVYEDVLKRAPSDIIDAQYTMYEGTPCIYVEAKNPALNYRERYWISTENGLLIFGQTLSKDMIIYSVKASSIEIKPQADSVFILPGGKLAINAVS